jgi:hypothetical protein
VTNPTKRLRAELFDTERVRRRRRGIGAPEFGQHMPGYHPATGLILVSGQRTVIDPSSDGIVADPK